MKIMITGSSGYLGNLLTRFLVSKNIQVVGIGLGSHPFQETHRYFRYYRCNITDKAFLSEIFTREQPTHVVHLAGTFNKVRNRRQEHDIDIGGSKNILDLCESTASVKQLVYSSSAAAYGGHVDNPEWIPESRPLRPGNYRYGMIKALTEKMYLSFPARKDLRIVVLRICSVTGPSYSPERNVLNMLYHFPVLPRVCMHNRIQLLHQDDFVTLMYRILSDTGIRGALNMAPDSYALVRDLAPDKIYLPVPIPVLSLVLSVLWHLRILNLRPGAVNYAIHPVILDPSRMVQRYNYQFKYSTAEAYAEVVFPELSGTLEPGTRKISVS